MQKKQEDVCSTQEILQRAIDILQTVKDNSQLCEELYLRIIQSTPTVDDSNNITVIKNIITEYLFRLGIPTNYIGYDQLKSVILLKLKSPKNMPLDKCYQQVAEFYDCIGSSVYRNIRTVLIKAYSIKNAKNKKVWEKMFGNSLLRKGEVSNSEFISRAVEDIRVMLN